MSDKYYLDPEDDAPELDEEWFREADQHHNGKLIVKRKESTRPRMLGSLLTGEDQQFLIDTYYKPNKKALQKYVLNEDDWLSKCEFPVTKLGYFDKRTTKAAMVDYTFPGKEYLQQYEWGKKTIKRRR